MDHIHIMILEHACIHNNIAQGFYVALNALNATCHLLVFQPVANLSDYQTCEECSLTVSRT